MSLTSVVSFFKALGTKVHAELVAVFGQSAIDAVEAQIKTILTGDMQVLFTDAVTAASSLANATGTQKHDAAFAQISTDLKSQGKTLETSVINMGIELVVNLLKAKS